MATSVPPVIPDQKIRDMLAECLILSKKAAVATGNIEYVAIVLAIIRAYYEQNLKPAANAGRLDYATLDAYRRAIERLDCLIAKYQNPAKETP